MDLMHHPPPYLWFGVTPLLWFELCGKLLHAHPDMILEVLTLVNLHVVIIPTN